MAVERSLPMGKPKQSKNTALPQRASKQESIYAKAKLKRKHHRINWHHAACETLKIELKDYEEYLEFHEEYLLGKSKDEK